MNILLLLLAFLFYIIYSTFDPAVPSSGESFKYLTYGLLLIVCVSNIVKNGEGFVKSYAKESFFFICLLCFHFKMTTDDVFTAFMPLFIFLILTSASVTKYKMECLGGFLLLFYGGLVVFDLNGMIRCIFSPSYDEGWKSIFYNSNIASVFICSVFCATYLFLKNKLLIVLSFVLTVGGLLACKSRNALLFFLIVNFFLFFKPWCHKRQKYFPFIVCFFLLAILYYMIVIEPYLVNVSFFNLFGKSEGSTGRAFQILFVIQNFDSNLWGYGRSLINEAVTDEVSYVIHNLYINTLYAMGWAYFLFYLYFVYRFYNYLQTYESRIFLLSFHVYFFFETGIAWGFALNYFLPMLIIAYSSINYNRDFIIPGYESRNSIS